ncbi:sulfotransferase domain-containing protein [Spirillospora sp. NPDC029432]|uniref:sulfotransferase domain-containing protein n=1 Tax=Spirillospora sp. NPDC029432 TaxID=3154599 RepID=UPI003456A5E3
MTPTTSDAGQPDGDERSNLHVRNARRLGPDDIVMATQPGSGATLLGNIMLELDIDVMDPFGVVIETDGSVRANEDVLTKRERISAVAAKERSLRSGSAAGNPDVRFFKNFLPPESYAPGATRGAVVLVRDPRDAMYSKYRFLRDFGNWIPGRDDIEEQGSFAEFLDGRGAGPEPPPIENWTAFYGAWAEAADRFERFTVLRFEDLKADTFGAVCELLDLFQVKVPPDEIAAAVERSSFDAMRKHEDAHSAATGDAVDARIMRRGKVREWEEWFGDPELAERFRNAELIATAARLGYSLFSDA